VAGPCAEVFLPTCTSNSLLDQIKAWIDAVSDLHDGLDFWVTNSDPIGGSYKGEGRPFFFRLSDIDIAPPDEWCEPNAEEIVQVANEFGFQPKSRVSFCAMCNDQCDNQVLAELCSLVAKELGGVINFHGPVPFDIRALEGLPGVLRPIFFDSKHPDDGFSHHCDAEFLAGWLRHPAFRMVK